MQNYERTSSVWAAYTRRLSLVAALIIASAALSPRAAAQDESAPPPSQAAPDSARIYAAPSSVWNAQRVRRVIEDGTRVMLTDGTVWEVYLPDRPAVSTWKPGDLLIVREAAVSQGDYDFTIKDGRTRRAVSARLIGDSNERS